MDVEWNKHFKKLEEFQKKHGFGKYPSTVEKNKEERILGQWCTQQRGRYNKGILDKTRIKNLEKKGFIWNPLEANWETRFNQLKTFCQMNDMVPSKYSKNKNERLLDGWLHKQRMCYRTGKLNEQRN